jgi:hypothetical protein
MPAIDIVYQTDPATGQLLFDADGYPLLDGTANTGALTYAQMQARVSNEVLGLITIDDVKNAIQDAISRFERETFYGNSIRYFGQLSGSSSDLVTVAGKEFYSYADLHILSNMPHIMGVTVLAFANRYSLTRRTPQWFEDVSVSPAWQGMPTDYTVYPSGMLRIYPIPNDGYPLILNGTMRLRPLDADADYSFWTNRGEKLIRCEAKRNLFVDLTRDEDQAAIMQKEIYGDPTNPRFRGALADLQGESARRTGSGSKLRASRGYF